MVTALKSQEQCLSGDCCLFFFFLINFWLALVAVRMQRRTGLFRKYLFEDKLMYIATERNESLGKAI